MPAISISKASKDFLDTLRKPITGRWIRESYATVVDRIIKTKKVE